MGQRQCPILSQEIANSLLAMAITRLSDMEDLIPMEDLIRMEEAIIATPGDLKSFMHVY